MDKAPASQTTGVCDLYQQELQRKAELQCEQKAAMSDIQLLSKEVHQLAEESQRAFLMKKWGSQPTEKINQKELPEIQTHRLCMELLEDQEQSTDILQGLQQQQSKLDSEIAKVTSELKGYYAKS